MATTPSDIMSLTAITLAALDAITSIDDRPLGEIAAAYILLVPATSPAYNAIRKVDDPPCVPFGINRACVDPPPSL